MLSKPIGRAQFLLAKYVGLAAALTMLTYVNTLAALLAGRMAFDAYGDADTQSLAIFFGGMTLAYLIAGLSNYFLRRPFVADAVFGMVVMSTLAFVVIVFFTKLSKPFNEVGEVDWRMVKAAILILFALFILAGLALACSTRYEMIPHAGDLFEPVPARLDVGVSFRPARAGRFVLGLVTPYPRAQLAVVLAGRRTGDR